ncbi:hypothetical protein [Marinobacter sp.]|uniref:hypothetical protein n=1 Tax=Marinobacter sp. TaxID=50741 RepID=UPI003A8CFCC4
MPHRRLEAATVFFMTYGDQMTASARQAVTKLNEMALKTTVSISGHDLTHLHPATPL